MFLLPFLVVFNGFMCFFVRFLGDLVLWWCFSDVLCVSCFSIWFIVFSVVSVFLSSFLPWICSVFQGEKVLGVVPFSAVSCLWHWVFPRVFAWFSGGFAAWNTPGKEPLPTDLFVATGESEAIPGLELALRHMLLGDPLAAKVVFWFLSERFMFAGL